MDDKKEKSEYQKSMELEDEIDTWKDIVGSDLSRLMKKMKEAKEKGNLEEYERLEKERHLVGRVLANGHYYAEETEYGRQKIVEAREERKRLEKLYVELLNKNKK